MRGKIYVVPIHRPMTVNLRFIVESVSKRFSMEAQELSCPIDVHKAFDKYRNQYHSTELLSQLVSNSPPDTIRILGLTDLDLFIPILTYVFGEAQLDGTAAVVSCYRLKNELYGIPPNNLALQSRLLKEAIHELGHTFGLVHCEDPVCVMRVSTYVEEIDLKGDDFCRSCRAYLQRRLELIHQGLREASS